MTRSLVPVIDGETALGLVPNEPNAAQDNRIIINDGLANQFHMGSYAFRNAQQGPIRYAICMGADEYFIDKPIVFPDKCGALFVGAGGRSYPQIGDFYELGTGTAGSITRVTRLYDPLIDTAADDQCIVRMCGTGAIVRQITFNGRPYVTDATGEGPTSGNITPIGFELEGRTAPPTGMNFLADCTLSDVDSGIKIINGYYNASHIFVPNGPNGQHGDNCMVYRCIFWNNLNVFLNTNPQGMVWGLRDIQIGGWGGAGFRPTVLANMVAGGNVWFDGVSFNSPKATIFRCEGYSHYNANLICANLYRDGFPILDFPDQYLKLFEYAGPLSATPDNYSWIKYRVRINGIIGDSEDSPGYDVDDLITVPGASFPTDDIQFDIKNLPRTYTKPNQPATKPGDNESLLTGLREHWRLEDVSSAGGSGGNALVNTGATPFRYAKLGLGASFDNVTTRSLAADGVTLTGSTTMDCWIKFRTMAYPGNSAGIGCIMGKNLWGGDTNGHLSLVSYADYLCVLLYTSTGFQPPLYEAQQPLCGIPLTAFDINQWYHIGATVNVATSKMGFILNGCIRSEHTFSGTFSNVVSPFIIGAMNGQLTTTKINATVDDVGIWDRALTNAELSVRFNKGLAQNF